MKNERNDITQHNINTAPAPRSRQQQRRAAPCLGQWPALQRQRLRPGGTARDRDENVSKEQCSEILNIFKFWPHKLVAVPTQHGTDLHARTSEAIEVSERTEWKT